ncbi:MAG: trypsin-like peptidase domain-containing protein [bacterium]
MLKQRSRFPLVMTVLTAVLLSFMRLTPALAAGPDAGGLTTAIVQVANQNIPAVVHIEVTERQEIVNPMSPFQNDPFFRYFFGVPNAPKKFRRELKGLGTGMIMDARGDILTNNHVVGGATRIEVLLSTGEKYPGSVVGTDPKTDLAVIRIKAKEDLPHVTFGDSDDLQVGEWVVAIGHPRGLDQTVTQGIISAKHRRGITDPSTYQDFLQTDAAINPGNSGGPLLNLKGEVVGVNAAIASESGGFEGIGFAIPSNMAVHVAKSLIEHGKVVRGWLGVAVQDLSPELAGSFGVKETRGALIADVTRGGPADAAGLKRGDIVLAFDGKQIPDAATIQNEAANTAIGREVKVTLLRRENKLDVLVKMGSQEEAGKIMAASLRSRLGADVRPIRPAEAEKYGLGEQGAVAIAGLDPKGPLTQSGLEVGDLILAVNDQPIESLEDFANTMSTIQPGQRIALLALDHRTGDQGYVQVEVR